MAVGLHASLQPEFESVAEAVPRRCAQAAGDRGGSEERGKAEEETKEGQYH